ncbi:MAG: LLM class flavin-dependent oxidoreductase [Actinomycetota bacterium]|nr:LLM class flavin-dependent oxidoreductase [Actinomycetota bacterium]
MDLSCAFATSIDTPEHVAVAEDLGYTRAWLYDSPALYPDVWAMLALAADRTERIGLGPAVLVPSLRHPMVNAAAVATLAELAPGRVAVALGAGFTGRHVLGQRPMRWADVERYVEVLRALLRGEDAEWDGATIAMIHPDGFGAKRPIEVPVLIGGDGPKGWAVAKRLGDGLFSSPGSPLELDDVPTWRARLTFGTVLADGETPMDERVLDAAGHGLAVAYHGLYERGGAEAVDRLPAGAAWRARVEEADPARRHLLTHENHLVSLSEQDRIALRDGAPMLPSVTFTGTADDLRARAAQLEATGTTELVYQPAGPDIAGELTRMAEALGAG